VSARLLVAAGVAGAAVLGLCGLSMIGAPTAGTGDGWTGWTGQVDAESVSDKAAMTPDDASAVRLLERSAEASRTVAYTGRVVVEDGSQSQESTLLHVPGLGTVSMSAGSDGVRTPMYAADGRSGSFADAGRQLDLLATNYRVLREAALDTTVAGREADAVVAEDEGVVAARFWLDRETGLLLRKELLDDEGAVRDRAGFETFSTKVDSGLVERTAGEEQDDAWSEVLSDAALAQARQGGCDCPEALPGGLTLVETRRAPAGSVGEVPVIHQLFSDGLVTVSLFSLAGQLSESDLDGLQARGYTKTRIDGLDAWVSGGTSAATRTAAVWQCEDEVLTLVTDDAAKPIEVVGSVLSALPPSTPAEDSSFWGRVSRGWDRVTGQDA
jgi:sigma-E factor negative regulatory protein RseB